MNSHAISRVLVRTKSDRQVRRLNILAAKLNIVTVNTINRHKINLLLFVER